MGHDDASYRKLFAHKELVRDLLACVLDEALFEILDWAHMEPLPTTYVAGRLQQRTGDAAWRIPYKPAERPAKPVDYVGRLLRSEINRNEPATSLRTKDERCLYVLLLFEHQSRSDAVMALRMAVYAGLLYESLVRSEHLGPPLPPILPVVFYSGTRPWRAASDLEGLLEAMPDDLRPYQLGMRYLLVAERDLLAAGGLPDRNLLALMLRMGRGEGLEQWPALLHTLVQVVQGPEFEELNRSLTGWLVHVANQLAGPTAVLPPVTNLQELEMTISERQGLWARQWKQEGLQQGLAEGMQQGQADLLLRQITRRFGPVPDAIAKRVRSADASLLEQWALNVLDATTLDEVFR